MTAALVAISAACTTEPRIPIQTFSTDFDDRRWDGWEPDTAYMTVGGEVVEHSFMITDTMPGFSSPCVQMGAANYTAAIHQWIVRDFDLAPGRYEIAVRWKAGFIHGEASHLTAIGFIGTRRPRPTEEHYPFERLPGLTERSPPSPPEPATIRMRKELHLSEGDDLWVAVGYTSGFAVFQRICMDDVVVEVFEEDSAEP